MQNIQDQFQNMPTGATAISITTAFLIGGLIGAAVALLMAPQSGARTRQMIQDKSNELMDRASGAVDDTRSKATHTINNLSQQTKDRVSSLQNRGQQMVGRSRNC